MKTAIHIIDDAVDNASEIRKLAMGLRFGDVDHAGYTYRNISVGEVNLLTDHGLTGIIEEAAGFKVNMAESFFRSSMANDKTPVWIHADIGCGDYAAILHLTAPEMCQGGTAFWFNKAIQSDRIPSRQAIERSGMDYAEFCQAMDKEGQSQEGWVMKSLIGMKFNRMLIYPTDFFHSRFPRDAWGFTHGTSRLIWVCFFNRKDQ